jgi:hypothetical protein
MSDSPRVTQIKEGSPEPHPEPKDAQGKHRQEVQDDASLLADVLAEARQVLADEKSANGGQQTTDGRPIRQAAQNVRAIPTYVEPELSENTDLVNFSPATEANIDADARSMGFHLDEPLPLEPAPTDTLREAAGLCSDERRALIEPIADFDAFERAPGPSEVTRLPWPIELFALPRRLSTNQRRVLDIAAITIACWVPVVWGIAVFMPPAESAREATAAIQVAPLVGPEIVVAE